MSQPEALPPNAEVLEFAPAQPGWISVYLDRVEAHQAHVIVIPVAGWATCEWETTVPRAPGAPEVARIDEDGLAHFDTVVIEGADVATMQAVRPWIATTRGLVRDYMAVEVEFLCLLPPGIDVAGAVLALLGKRDDLEPVEGVDVSLGAN